ncbi:MAG: 5-carboxymethyl-2-hydroxymuconate delta-isomerase [Hyphomicrobiales bacterium]|nr:5-carboxymethyl-2-hydroxymuconate delta-isomerase [Hyphomicrobiales bacterium]
MKICRYDNDRLGVVIGDNVHDVSAVQDQIRAAAPYAMMGDAVIAALPEWRTRLEEAAKAAPPVPLSSVKLLSPVARWTKTMAAPTNYRKHIAEMEANRAGAPSKMGPDIGKAGLFLKANSSVVGASEGIAIRFPDRRNDHEAELVVVIGKKGTDIPMDRALDYVAGYALGLDMTVRGPEDRSFRKSVDSYSPVGPWMVTADEVPNPDDVSFTLHVNDEKRQDSNTSEMVYSVRRLIEFASSFYTLHPGDLLFTGTPEGVGPVQPGDVVRVASVPALGTLQIAVRAHKIGG